MTSTKAKRIVFRYNEDAKSDEEEFDSDGEFPAPERGALIAKHGKHWRTVRVEWVIGASGQIPILRVFLTDLNMD